MSMDPNHSNGVGRAVVKVVTSNIQRTYGKSAFRHPRYMLVFRRRKEDVYCSVVKEKVVRERKRVVACLWQVDTSVRPSS